MRLFFIGLLWLGRGAKKILPSAEDSQRNERGAEGCFHNEAVNGRLDWSRWIGWSEQRAMITMALRPMNPPMKKSAVLRRGAARLAAMSKPKMRISGLAQIAMPMDAPTSMA